MSTPVVNRNRQANRWILRGCGRNFRRCRLQVNGQPAAFLDGPAGTQVPTAGDARGSGLFYERERQHLRRVCHQPRSDEMISIVRGGHGRFFQLR